MNEGKGLGLKWFNFLYGWFIFKIIIDSLGLLGSFGQIKNYESMYGSLYGINELIYWIIFSAIVSVILKLIAVLTKHKENGYAAINIVLIWDILHWFIWGLQYDLFGAIFAPLLASAFILPTLFYLRKRKFVYGITNDSNVQKTSPQFTPKCEMCDKEDNNLIYAKIVDDYGTRYRNLCSDCVKTHHAEIIEKKDKKVIKSDNNPHTEKIKFCRKCGEELLINSEFCSKCGTEVIKHSD